MNKPTRAEVKGSLPIQHIADAIWEELYRQALDRWTVCAIVQSISNAIDDNYYREDEGKHPRETRSELFREACGYYEWADHDSMEGFPYSRTRDAD